MSYSLKKMLSGMTAIPYNDSLLQNLIEACESYNMESRLESVSELSRAFISGVIPQRFRDCIQNAIRESEPTVVVPNEALVCLAQYAVLSRIHEEADLLKQSVYATMLMNYMLVHRNQFDKIPNRDEVLSVYQYHISHYISLHDSTKIGISSDLRARVPDNIGAISELSAEDQEGIRSVFKESAYYTLEKRLESEELRSIKNPYVRMFCGVKDMVDNIPYLYYNISIENVFSKLCNDKELRSRKKLSSILIDLRNNVGSFEYNDCTSILLRALDDEDSDCPAWTNVLNQQFTLKEFSVYLYFEILIEKIIDTL